MAQEEKHVFTYIIAHGTIKKQVVLQIFTKYRIKGDN
jgi:hypothetical protein